MNLRACDSCFDRSSSWPQYGQRRHPSGYVFLQAVQRMLLGRGMLNRRALYTSAVDAERRCTLLALIEIAGANSPTACWDDARAMDLLRSQSNAAELRELGMDERLIEHIFAESHAG